MGIVSTNALEVGIDIGSLDSVIISGYPGTRISTWQQAGRAGRSGTESLATLIAFENPLDQYYMKYPDRFFNGTSEEAIIDLYNPHILMGHLMCASAEIPLTPADSAYFGDISGAIEAISGVGLIKKTPRGYAYAGIKSATEVVDLKNISSQSVKVICDGGVIETMEVARACSEAHEGAIFLHQGETYHVEELDLKKGVATVMQRDVDYYTESLKIPDISIEDVKSFKNINGHDVFFGDVSVTEHYYRYVEKRYEKVLAYHDLDLPPQTFHSEAVWFTLQNSLYEKMISEQKDFDGGIHALEHAMIAMAPLFALCDRWDIGGLSTPKHADTGMPTIFIYDGYDGGIGIAEKCYHVFPELTKATKDLIEKCECSAGCPSCIYSPKCGNMNSPLDKAVALELLKMLSEKPTS